MLPILLSPAKRLRDTKDVSDLDSLYSGDAGSLSPSIVLYSQKSETLIESLKKKSARQLSTMMHISPKLAELNVQRYQQWENPSLAHLKESKGGLAVLMFAGEVYQGLNAQALSPVLLRRAQERLRILSGLHGILRPLDVIFPYRLEMGSSLKPPKRGVKNLSQFWSEDVTSEVAKVTDKLAASAVLNLASAEYSAAVTHELLPVPMIAPKFLNKTKVGYRPVSFIAKKARGVMARWALVNDISDVSELQEFSEMGYTYDPNKSEPTTPVFLGN